MIFLVCLLAVIVSVTCSTRNSAIEDIVLYDFENEEELDFLQWKCGTIMQRDRDHATSGRYSLRIEMYPRAVYPGFHSSIHRGFAGFKRLNIDIYNPASTPINLAYRIDDRQDSPPYDDRANGRFIIEPGENTISLDLVTLMTSGTRRKINLDKVRNLLLFVHRPPKVTTFYLDNIRLSQK